MKTTIIIGIFIVLILSVIAGCNTPTQTEDDATSAEKTAVNETQPVDIVEKRGQKTNITEFNELMRRASNIQSYKYNITDTGVSDDEYRFYVLGRFIKIDLPDTEKQPSGEKYDEVFLDRVTKTAFSHCSSRLCTKPNIDKGLEKVQYEKYYLKDPMEYLYFARDPQYVKEEMIGDETTKVFDITFENRPARIWLQEYYGFPMKIMVKNEDNTKRVIRFEDMMVDATKRGEIDLPFNFTVKNEKGSWIFWEHYLGLWPEKKDELRIDPSKLALST